MLNENLVGVNAPVPRGGVARFVTLPSGVRRSLLRGLWLLLVCVALVACSAGDTATPGDDQPPPGDDTGDGLPDEPLFPGRPTNLVALPGVESVTISFTSTGPESTNHDYRVGDAAWTPFDPPAPTSPVTLEALVPGATSTITLRAVNAEGASEPSDPIAVTPWFAPYALRAGGSQEDEGWAVALLPDGGAIVVGEFIYTVSFGAHVLEGEWVDAFVAKVGPTGEWLWAKRVGGEWEQRAQAVAVLEDGSAIVSGTCMRVTTFGGDIDDLTCTETSDVDVFVAKIDADGTWLWANRMGAPSYGESVGGISVLTDGSAIITGRYRGGATFGGSALTLPPAGYNTYWDLYVAKIGADGSWLWATGMGGGGDEYHGGITVLSDDSAIVVGSFQGTASFLGNAALSLVSAGSGSIDAVVAKLDRDGAWLWAERMGGSQTDWGYAVSGLSDGGAIIAGSFSGTASFGDGSTVAALTGTDDGYVARISAEGEWLWAERMGGGTSAVGAYGVSTHADAEVYVAGTFTHTASFGDDSIPSITSGGSLDAFIAKISVDGEWRWANRMGGSFANVQARAVSVSTDGSAVLTGTFSYRAEFPDSTLETLWSAGSTDIFVARIRPDGSW
jgi:hypothetical protein